MCVGWGGGGRGGGRVATDFKERKESVWSRFQFASLKTANFERVHNNICHRTYSCGGLLPVGIDNDEFDNGRRLAKSARAH